MALTYEPIATTTLGSASSTITFSSISSAYTDLRLVVVGRKVTSGSSVLIRFNGDTNTNYSFTIVQGNGSAASSSRVTDNTAINLTLAVNMETAQLSLYQVDIFSYAGSTNKTLLFTQGADYNNSGATAKGVGLWRSTSAINSITFAGGDTYATGTTATLYGIKAA